MVMIRPIMVARYASIVLPPVSQIHDFLEGYLKYLPRYNGETRRNAKDHLFAFLDFADNMNIEHEDVYVRLFVQ